MERAVVKLHLGPPMSFYERVLLRRWQQKAPCNLQIHAIGTRPWLWLRTWSEVGIKL